MIFIKGSIQHNLMITSIGPHRFFVFLILGTPTGPQCGFSRRLVEILNSEGFAYDYFDILSDDNVTYSKVIIFMTRL